MADPGGARESADASGSIALDPGAAPAPEEPSAVAVPPQVLDGRSIIWVVSSAWAANLNLT